MTFLSSKESQVVHMVSVNVNLDGICEKLILGRKSTKRKVQVLEFLIKKLNESSREKSVVTLFKIQNNSFLYK